MKVNYFLPNYEQAVQITKSDDTFYEKQTEVCGVKVSVFNYRLSQYKNFVSPIESNPEIKAHEMRGLTFIHTEKGPVRYLMLHKFFNLNQVPGYQFEDVKNLKVIRSQDKCDGSMVRFLKIADTLVAKTKMDFTNDQCKMAIESAHKQNLVEFINKTIEQKLAAIFELVSPWNQIVLQYETTELRLLQLRDEETGEYYDIYNHDLVKQYKVKCSDKEESQDLQNYIERAKTEENREGWILTLSNGQMMKIKTAWYCALHGLLTSDLARENKIIGLILDEKLDDSFGMIGEKDARRLYSEQIQAGVVKYLDKQLKEGLELKSTYAGDRKAFALANLKHPLFSAVVKVVEEKDSAEDKLYALLKAQLARNTSGLMEAKSFVADVLGITLKNLEESFDTDG